ncbi:MAG: 50S ribosomal protein L35 [Candidatus Magasanikbacteria bacterium GW2011_GWA2_37_8]|uniref:Large ribosomal subunit protein bL35 n=1 Tax=Candidatus Magasanikbacteria bacterium GW2011_GWA2_37_8 TaxID=1619036 RepID=A0A0G0HDU9_9BACT|nr:MAG: 50S ribosomal protein L35 [Candidatus Magasanikbacteria bacterium GW2011_GWA2_37_8]
MPKLKTHQATAKRYKLTKNKKIKKVTCGQNHFNSRENGKVGRNKKSDTICSSALDRVMQIALPHA